MLLPLPMPVDAIWPYSRCGSGTAIFWQKYVFCLCERRAEVVDSIVEWCQRLGSECGRQFVTPS